MRVLFFGDIGPTGFGTVTQEIGRRLVDKGVDVRFVSQNDVPVDKAGNPIETMPAWIVPRCVKLNSLSPMTPIDALLDGSSTASMWDDSAYVGWAPDAAVILADLTATRAIVGEFVPAFSSVPTFHYCPIEGVGLPPAWKELWDVVHPIAMSKFGAREMEKVIGYMPPMIYHGVDTEKFHPVSAKRPIVMEVPDKPAPAVFSTKVECKKTWMAFMLEGRNVNRMPPTWILRTDRHMPRKRHNAMLRSLTPLLQRYPDVALIFHCRPYDQGGYLYDATSKLPGLVRFDSDRPKESDSIVCGIEGRDYPQVIVTNAWGVNDAGLTTLYNAADIYASVSAEGFGLTIAEALACGVPAVGINYSAVPEVIGKCGLTAPVSLLLDNEYDHYWAAIDERKFAEQVEKLIKYPSLRESLGADAPKHIASTFSWNTAADQFADLLSTATSIEAAA